MLRLFIFLIVAITFIYTSESMKQRNGSTCKSMDCEGKIKKCPYGYRTINDCEICRCYDPCNPSDKAMLCGVNKRCFVHKTIGGTFVARCDSLRSKRNKDVCEQEKVVGVCKAAFRRFYYDSTAKKCKEFIYGGCRGNDNNFETREKCEESCLT